MIHGITQVCPQVSDNNGEHTRLKVAGMIFHREPQTVVAA